MLSLLTALCALRLPDAPASAPRYGFPSGNVLGRTASTCPPTISTVRAVLVPEPPESQGSLRCWNWDFNPTDIPPRPDLLLRSGRVSQPYSVTYDPCDESVTLDHIFHDKMMQPAWPPWPGVNPHVNPHRNETIARLLLLPCKMLLDQSRTPSPARLKNFAMALTLNLHCLINCNMMLCQPGNGCATLPQSTSVTGSVITRSCSCATPHPRHHLHPFALSPCSPRCCAT